MGSIPAAAAAASTAIANAVRAFGTIVRLEPDEFMRILSLQKEPLIVEAKGGFFSRGYRYMTSYKGLAFFCRSRAELNLPSESLRIRAKRLVVPEM